MEWALGAPDFQSLKLCTNPWQEALLKKTPEIHQSLEELAGPINFTRLYFGQEFCERDLPSTGQLLKAVEKAQNQRMDFTLVTPYVTEEGLKKLEVLLRELATLTQDPEVVVNDWGVLNLLHKKFPALEPVLGRLLNKTWRDPRMTQVPAENQEPFRRCSLAGPHMQRLLRQFRVSRVELDYPFQGLDESLPDWGFTSSLYLPYGCITTGRICLLGSWGRPAAEKFNPGAKNCSQKCKSYWLELKDASGQVEQGPDWRIVQRGNAVFYVQLRQCLRKGLTQAKSLGVDRVVFQPRPL